MPSSAGSARATCRPACGRSRSTPRLAAIEVSAPEGRDSGGYTLAITAATRDRLTFGPDRGCDVPEQRAQPASARLALTRAILTFQAVRGGCTSAWALLSAIPWRQA